MGMEMEIEIEIEIGMVTRWWRCGRRKQWYLTNRRPWLKFPRSGKQNRNRSLGSDSLSA